MASLKLVYLSDEFIADLYNWRKRRSAEKIMGKPFIANYEQHYLWCQRAMSDKSSVHVVAVLNEIPIAYCSAKDYKSEFPIGGFVLGDDGKSYLCISILRQFYSFLKIEKGVTKLFGYISYGNKRMFQINRAMGWSICEDPNFSDKISETGVDLSSFSLIELDLNNGRY